VLSTISYLFGLTASSQSHNFSSNLQYIRPLTFAYIHTCRIHDTQEPMMFGVKPAVTHDKPSLRKHK